MRRGDSRSYMNTSRTKLSSDHSKGRGGRTGDDARAAGNPHSPRGPLGGGGGEDGKAHPHGGAGDRREGGKRRHEGRDRLEEQVPSDREETEFDRYGQGPRGGRRGGGAGDPRGKERNRQPRVRPGPEAPQHQVEAPDNPHAKDEVGASLPQESEEDPRQDEAGSWERESPTSSLAWG